MKDKNGACPLFRGLLQLRCNLRILVSSISFLGRDSQQNEDTLELIPGTRKLLVPHYSHWTIGYLLSLRGARKLVEAKPLENLIPVDNYFHVLAKTHPE